VSKLLDFLKAIQLPPRFLFAAAAVGLLFLLMPETWSEWLGVGAFLEDARGWIALAASCAFFFGWAQLAPSLLRQWRRRKAIREILGSLDSLSADERMLLGYCAYRKRRTVLLQLTSAEANCAHGLCQKGLMEEAVGGGSILGWPFTIPSEIWPAVASRQDSLLGKDWRKNAATMRRIVDLDKRTSADHGGHEF
jgi:hypothetical protein